MNLKTYSFTTFFLIICLVNMQAQIIFSENFSSGFPADWTNVDIASIPGEEVLFEFTTNPNAVATAALGDPDGSTFLAPGASNGFIWANSDRGLPEAPTNIHITELSTPAINCASEDNIFFSMYALIGTFFFDAEDNAILRVSTDNLNWTEYTLFPNLTIEERWSANPYFAAINISEVAANEPTVYLQIQWTGGWEYFMAIDNFVLSRDDPRPSANMRINDFAAIAPNVWRPLTQVEPIGFIADIENVGSEEQTNIELTIEVTEGTSSTVFMDQLDYGDMVPDQLTENVLFENQFEAAASQGNYLATYSLTYDNDNEQSDPGLVSRSFPIVVTDTIFAKENGVTRGVDPAEDNEYSYGCVYHINKDVDLAGNPLFATSITFGVTNADEIEGEFATILLLEWDGDLDGSFAAEQTEYTIVGFNSYQFTGNEDLNLITLAANEDGPVPLIEGKYYIAAIQFTSNNPLQRFILQASEDYDYLAMQFYTDSIDMPRWASALDISNEGAYSLIGFGFDIVPIVRLGISGIVATQEPQLHEGAISIFPNPANTYVNLSIELEEETEGLLFIYDAKGALVNTRQLGSIHQNQIRLETKDLPSGMYNLRLQTPLGVSHLPLSVQH